MFGPRIFSGVVLALLAVFILYFGGNVLFLTSLAISCIGLFELYRVLKIHNRLLGVCGYLAVLLYYWLIFSQKQIHEPLLIISFLMLLMAVYVFTFPKYNSEQVTIAFFGVFYVAVMLSYIYKTRMLADGAYMVWMIFICSWICDTCAYFVGKSIGRHKLAPKLSPKKSIEGSIGGVFGSMLVGAAYAFLIRNRLVELQSPEFAFAVICGLGAVISQIGDLAASAIKRNHEVKDYGNLIPGHGGILDRFDSVIFTAPAVYFLALMFI